MLKILYKEKKKIKIEPKHGFKDLLNAKISLFLYIYIKKKKKNTNYLTLWKTYVMGSYNPDNSIIMFKIFKKYVKT